MSPLLYSGTALLEKKRCKTSEGYFTVKETVVYFVERDSDLEDSKIVKISLLSTLLSIMNLKYKYLVVFKFEDRTWVLVNKHLTLDLITWVSKKRVPIYKTLLRNFQLDPVRPF